jgi:hypothetical protein
LARGHKPSRDGKAKALAELQARGFYLIDLSEDPFDGQSLEALVPDLVRRCQQFDPRRIIVITAKVYDLAFGALREAGLPVVAERIPFPWSRRQREFLDAFGRALRS